MIAAGDARHVLGLCGPPGAGKSTLAEAIRVAVGGSAAIVPMDGFHLAGSELVRLGRAGRKGAPDTFDVEGYVALLGRLRTRREAVVYAPEFRRDIEEAVAGAIPVGREVRLVITEGNYLLHDDAGWGEVRPLLDEAWYLETDADARRSWLLARHVAFGRTIEAAQAWVEATDEPNARLIARGRERADQVIRVT